MGRTETLLDAGSPPVEDLAVLAAREARRPTAIYGAHRWFARRQGTAMRALLVASQATDAEEFWRLYEGDADLRGAALLDPFMGGGTSLVEGRRLGADVHGVDIDSVACAVTAFQLAAAATPDLGAALTDLKAVVGASLRNLYQTTGPDGQTRDVVHWFWVQTVECAKCGEAAEAHPHHRLAFDATTKRQTVFCPACHSVADVSLDDEQATCATCQTTYATGAGTVTNAKFTCPSCGNSERLVDRAARTRSTPTWRLFASESVPPDATRNSARLADRIFLPTTAEDQERYTEASRRLRARTGAEGIAFVPSDDVPTAAQGSDDRLARYGYRQLADLFNSRQLLHLSLLAEAIAARPANERKALALAFSDHLTTNCMLTGYAFGWRRLSPLFAVRGYRHIVRPVELNPWLDRVGRGTFPNAVHAVERAVREARAPRTLSRDGGFVALPARGEPGTVIDCADSRSLASIKSKSIDLVLTDPPYMDYIAYHELADFYRPWLRDLGVLPSSSGTSASLAVAATDEAASEFEAGLKSVFSEVARVLAQDGRVVFTFRHREDSAYEALGAALRASGLVARSVFPLKGDGAFGLHAHEGSTSWDGVFVLAHGTAETGHEHTAWLTRAEAHVGYWTQRLRDAGVPFPDADVASFRRATAMAAALGVFDDDPELDKGDLERVQQAAAHALPGNGMRSPTAAVTPDAS